MEVTVRPATAADLAATAAIYDLYVIGTTATFDLHSRPLAVWRQRFEERVVNGPYHLLVAEHDREVVGYAETNPYNERAAYQPSLTTSVYCAGRVVGQGIGTALYGALLAAIDPSAFHRALAAIALPNPASIALHQRFGFVHRGTLTEIGHKFGRYWDVAWYEKALT